MAQELIELMEQLDSGLCWEWHVNPAVDDMLHHLDEKGYCTAREDIKPGLLTLTQKGRAALDASRNIAAEKAKQQAEAEAKEAARLKERREDQADAERRYRGQNKTTIVAALLSAVLGFVLGVLAEHFGSIIELLRALVGLHM